MMYYSVMTQTYSEQAGDPSALIRSRTQDLPITSLDAELQETSGSWPLNQVHRTNILHTARIGMPMCDICAVE